MNLVSSRTCLIALTSVLVVREVSAQTPPVLLQMIRDDAVHRELGLNEQEIGQVRAAHAAIDGRWWRSRNMALSEQQREISEVTSELEQALRGILDANQQKRLLQLQRQALGTRMFARPDVIEALSIEAGVASRLAKAFASTDTKSVAIQTRRRKGEITDEKMQDELASLKRAEQESVKAALSVDQRAQIASITGESFDFRKVKRTYPLAPELSESGSTWVQGGPVKLADLRGKVVAVHFYAYQCSNCVANIPHYNAWHEDLADQGLEIVGIQTPETSKEGKLKNVAGAAKRDHIKYPVLLDGSRSNWNTWHNTMWPTVYLVDKRGFIRRWWTGEMNWKGTPGEKQMRRTIETLLREE